MNKELVELQIGCKSTCVIIFDFYYKDLGRSVIMNASIGNEYLFGRKTKNPIFREKLDMLSVDGNTTYFVIRNIDKLSIDMQNRYVGLVKDREFLGYDLPKNVVIVFTVEDIESLKKVSKELYHLSALCF